MIDSPRDKAPFEGTRIPMKKICMVAYTYYLHDPRVRREAEALSQQGLAVDSEFICRFCEIPFVLDQRLVNIFFFELLSGILQRFCFDKTGCYLGKVRFSIRA